MIKVVRQTLPLLILLGVMGSCFLEETEEDWTDFWFRRCVLDSRPRMLILNPIDDIYLAYDLEYGLLYKMWDGGIHWDGAVYNSIKTINPESWGYVYYEDQELDLGKVEKELKFRGYVLDGKSMTLEWVLDAGDHQVKILERPTIETSGQNVTLVREWTIGMSARDRVDFQQRSFTSDSTYIIRDEYMRQTTPLETERILSTNPGMIWLERAGCGTCHELDETTVGPGYVEIASSYMNTDENTKLLTDRVLQGSSGAWGKTVMPPHPHLESADVEAMISFILGLGSDRPVRRRVRAKDTLERATPGFGAPVAGLHPSLQLERFRPIGFEPKVGGLDFDNDGHLYVACWDSVGAVYKVSNYASADSIQVELIAGGLSEPLGLKVVDNQIFVLQKHELTQLINLDEDPWIEEYRSVCADFQVSDDFHEFSYGLDHHDDHFYASLGLAMRLMASEQQLEDRGSVIKMDMAGGYEVLARGLRQPNGILVNDDGSVFVTENQGQWVPANKFTLVEEGKFYGCQYRTGDRFSQAVETPPSVWLPQDEIGNSPGQPLLISEGLYAGQFIHGEVTHGGIKRVFLEEVGGRLQGCVFRFSQGLESGINRMTWAPDGSLVVGGLAMSGNWGWKNAMYGLQRLTFTDSIAFELLRVGALQDGLRLSFTQPLHLDLEDLSVEQWRYKSTSKYGGDKLDLETLHVKQVVQIDETTFDVLLEGMQEDRVLYIQLSEAIQSSKGQSLWSGECWYTMNDLPGSQEQL